jgi:hypothetical protein
VATEMNQTIVRPSGSSQTTSRKTHHYKTGTGEASSQRSRDARSQGRYGTAVSACVAVVVSQDPCATWGELGFTISFHLYQTKTFGSFVLEGCKPSGGVEIKIGERWLCCIASRAPGAKQQYFTFRFPNGTRPMRNELIKLNSMLSTGLKTGGQTGLIATKRQTTYKRHGGLQHGRESGRVKHGDDVVDLKSDLLRGSSNHPPN